MSGLGWFVFGYWCGVGTLALGLWLGGRFKHPSLAETCDMTQEKWDRMTGHASKIDGARNGGA